MNEHANRWMHTDMGSTTPTSITVCGMDLADEIMGQISFPDLAFRMVSGRLPDEGESVLFNAVLVSLADHGITPTVLAARLTYLGAPEALQAPSRPVCSAAGACSSGSPKTRRAFSTRCWRDSDRRRTTPRCVPPPQPRSPPCATTDGELP